MVRSPDSGTPPVDDRSFSPEETLRLGRLSPEDISQRYDRILIEMRMALYGSIWKKEEDRRKVEAIIAAAEVAWVSGDFYLDKTTSSELSDFLIRIDMVLNLVCKEKITSADYPAVLLFLKRTKAKLAAPTIIPEEI